MMRRADLHGLVVVCALSCFPLVVVADTGSSLGDRSGEGSTPFSGLAQTPEANLFTGTLSTSIPIAVPPGRKNMTPKLVLEYSSGGGPSPYGYGWSLMLGSIHRTTRWGVPNCDNPHFDDFVMSMPGGGSAELVETGSGTNIYRPKVEQGYTEARFQNNTWTAYDSAGMTYTFGPNKDSRLGTTNDPPLEQTNPDGTCDLLMSDVRLQ